MSQKEKKKSNKKLEARIITLGDGAVGKTSLIFKYVDNAFSLLYLETAGIDSKMRFITLENGKEIKVVLTDTAGQERYRSIASNYIKKADGILLVYDITRGETFDGIKEWIKSIKTESEDSKPIILIGNKSDLNEERQIKKEDGKNFADNYCGGIKFYEISCKSGDNVEEAINDLVNQVYIKKYGNEQNEENNIKLEKRNIEETGRRRCC